MVNRIGFIGCTARSTYAYDGQTVSTRMWEGHLRNIPANQELIVVDTFNPRKRFITIIIDTIKCIFASSHIVFMLAENGMGVYFPLLYLAKKMHKKVFHRVVGGDLVKLTKANPKWVKYLNSFDVNWVQSPNMVKGLKELGVNNAVFLENFRDYDDVDLDLQNYNKGTFCTFCRVCREKGITIAINAVTDLAKERFPDIHLDIYGLIDDSYKEEFEHLLEENSEYVTYKGCIESQKALSVLKDYYFHLFPSTWVGEGFPGTIIDCYNAAVPTVASDWAYNSEYIIEGKTGLLYDWNNPEMLKERIVDAMLMPTEEYVQMKNNNLVEAKKYTSEYVMGKVSKFITER